MVLPSRSSLSLLLVVVWAGAILIGYQRIETPEPLAAIGLGLAWLTVFTLASCGVGTLICSSLCRPAPGLGAARLVIAAATGCGALMALAALLGLAGLLRPAVVTITLAALACLGVWRGAHKLGSFPQHLPRRLGLAWLLLGLAGVISLLAALSPSPFYDQLNYHLAFPFHWLRSGHITTFPRHDFSFLPANMSLLYSYALGSLGPSAAQALHWWMGALAVAGVGLLADRLGGPRAGAWGAALFATTPAVMLVATWAAADLGCTAFAIAMWVLLLTPRQPSDWGPRIGWWVLAGGLAGISAGCKILALGTVVAPALPVVALLGRAEPWKVRRGRTLAFILGVGLTLTPWLARNQVVTGNPVYPFLRTTLGAAAVAADAPDPPKATVWENPLPLRDMTTVLTLATFNPQGDAGTIGPWYLALLPLVVLPLPGSRRRRAVLALLAVALGVAAWAWAPRYARFLLPVLALLAVVLGAALGRLARSLRCRPRLAMDGLLAVGLTWNVVGGTTNLELRRVAATLGRDSTDAIFRLYVSYWPAVRYVNESLPESGRLLLVGEPRSMYLDYDVVVEDPFRAPLLVELARRCSSGTEIAAKLSELGVTAVLYNQHEAHRIAGMMGRSEYLAPLTPAQRLRLQVFWTTCLKRVFSEPPVEVYLLTCSRPAP
jgi:hypothetical protein